LALNRWCLESRNWLKKMSDEIKKRRQQVLYDKKWEKFLKRAWPFRHIPFVDFVLAAGSLAYGNIRKESDFDVIVAARSGRIFTARFFCAAAFGLLGWRRKRLSHDETAADKVCLNHFVIPASYRLSPPHNVYWKNLYFNLVPVFGDPVRINEFFAVNGDWLEEEKKYRDDLRHLHKSSSRLKIFFEEIFSGKFGDAIERFLKKIQVRRIERSLKSDAPGYKPRIIYSDRELEFHPDTKRIEIWYSLS